jgi:Photosynthesis system II assembly factor YCF48
MPSDDPKFERALGQHLRGGSAQANCPDAETLAAYHERNLSLEEMAQWKEHISACEACQEALALVETTENQLAEVWEERGIPVLEAASIQRAGAAGSPKLSAKADASTAPSGAATPVAILRRRPALLRWAIPLGAVAAGVLVFIGFYEQRSQKAVHDADAVIARREATASPTPALEDQETNAQSAQKSKDVQQTSPELSRQKMGETQSAALSTKPGERTKEEGDSLRESRGMAIGRYEAKKMPAPAPPPAAPDILAQTATDSAISRSAPVAVPRPASPSGSMAYGIGAGGEAAKAPARADKKSVPPAVTETVTVESAAPTVDTSTSSMMMKQGVADQVVEVTGAEAAGLILTPDNRVFWKLQSTGTVQLTTDGGKDWKSLETGANVDLTTGFAPSSSVCWIAGKSGTLLLTKDRGSHWTRINTPIAGDLGGVHAADAKHASIWDAAKHTSYETSDGGSTWKQTTNK